MPQPTSTIKHFPASSAHKTRRAFFEVAAAATAASLLASPQRTSAQTETLADQLKRLRGILKGTKPSEPNVTQRQENPNSDPKGAVTPDSPTAPQEPVRAIRNPNAYVTPDKDKLASDPKTGTDASLAGFGGKSVDLDIEIPASSTAAKKAYNDLAVYLTTPASLVFTSYDTGTSLKKEYIDTIIKSKALKISATQIDEINAELKSKMSATLSEVNGLDKEEKAEVLARAVRDAKSGPTGNNPGGSAIFLRILFKHLPEAKDVKVKYTAYTRMGYGPANALVANTGEAPVSRNDQSVRNYLKDFTAPLHIAGGADIVSEPPNSTQGRDKVDEIFSGSK